jgi:hypothetical protein
MPYPDGSPTVGEKLDADRADKFAKQTYDSFHFDTDGLWKAGDVIHVLPEGAPFGDAVILGFAVNGNMKCSRPYAYASSVGTTGPTVLLGAETLVYNPTELARFQLIGQGRVTT